MKSTRLKYYIDIFIELLCDEKGGMIFALFETKYH